MKLKFPKPKKKTKATAKKADELFAKLIRSRGRCQAKGLDNHPCGGYLQCAHIITRGVYALRFSEENALCLCSSHHRHFHSRPDLFYDDFIQRNFPKQYAYTKARRNELTYGKTDYKKLVEELEQKTAGL